MNLEKFVKEGSVSAIEIHENPEEFNDVMTQYQYVGTIGKGRELKTVKIWCEKEFGFVVPEALMNDSQLYTHKEVWQLLDQNGVR